MINCRQENVDFNKIFIDTIWSPIVKMMGFHGQLIKFIKHFNSSISGKPPTMKSSNIVTQNCMDITQCTVFLQRGSCIYREKSYGMSHGFYYKISMILKWPELEFSKINVLGAF